MNSSIKTVKVDGLMDDWLELIKFIRIFIIIYFSHYTLLFIIRYISPFHICMFAFLKNQIQYIFNMISHKNILCYYVLSLQLWFLECICTIDNKNVFFNNPLSKNRANTNTVDNIWKIILFFLFFKYMTKITQYNNITSI